MMKKVASKLVAVALTLAMVLACANPVFAADPDPTLITGTTGSITLTKYDSANGGKDGGAVVPGATFSAYQIISYENGSYEVVKGKGYEDIISADAVVGASGSSYGSTDALEAKISELQNHINSNNIEATGTADTNSNGVAELSNLPYGVYLVQETSVPAGYTISSQAFLVSVPQWDNETGVWEYNVEAYPKDQGITVEKTMEKADGEGQTNSDSYSIGDTIPYTVTATIPNYGDVNGSTPPVKVTQQLLNKGEYAKYNDLKVKFTDTLSAGLTLNVSAVEDLGVKILNSDGTEVILTESLSGTYAENTEGLKRIDENGNEVGEYDYVITKTVDPNTGITTMTVTFSWNALDAYQGKKIQLTYSARLNENAVIADPNTNDVKYNFKNDPQKDVGDAKGEVDPPDTETYTYQMELTKLLNGKEPGNVDVSPVTFRLYAGESAEGEALYVVKSASGVYTICTDKSVEGCTQDIHPAPNGTLSITGFKAGTYTLKETESIEGYTLLTKPVTIVVSEVEVGGKVTGTVKATTDDGKTWLTDEDGNATGVFALTVNNLKKQFNLPQTGGMGLWMFTIAGGILMAAAIIFFHKLRKGRRKGI